MLHKAMGTSHASAAVLEPDLVADVKKTEMKQAILNRFVYREKATAPAKPRSAFWQPVDEEC